MPVTTALVVLPCGTRNNCRQHLINFCVINTLYIRNIIFQHKAHKVSTQSCPHSNMGKQKAHAKDLMKTVTVHNQINYEKIKDTIANQSMLSLDFSIEQKY